jgi:hypothetical protein
MPMPPRSSQDLAPISEPTLAPNEQVSVVANRDARLFGWLVTGHVVPQDARLARVGTRANSLPVI